MIATVGNRPQWRILAIPGSLRAASSNAILLRASAVLAPHDTSVILYPGLGSLPPFNPDIEQESASPEVADFRFQLQRADAVLISSPEYAHGIPGVLKNALDWIVGSGELYGKPVALFTASPRATFVREALTETLTVMGAKLVPGASITVSMSAIHRDEQSLISDSGITLAIRAALLQMASAIGIDVVECPAASVTE